MQKKKIIKLFFAWQDEKEQAWLEQMAAHGWILDEINFILYTFGKAEPQHMQYCLDYQEMKQSDLQEYLGLFADAGWKYKGRLNNWFYFASKGPETREIYTDTHSKVEKYKRVLRTMLIASFPLIYYVFSYSRLLSGVNSGSSLIILQIIQFLIFIIWVTLIINIVRLWMKIQKMEKKI